MKRYTLFLREIPGAPLMHPPDFCVNSVQIEGCEQFL